MARTGVDEFYETIRLLIAKNFWEKAAGRTQLNYDQAQGILEAHKDVVGRFVEGGAGLCAPPEVANECFSILAPTMLSETSYEALHTVFEQMTGRQSKAEKGQYFTPSHVVQFCTSVLRPAEGELICDPACGSGAFLKSAFDRLGSLPPKNTIFGFDISKRASKTAALLSFLACEDLVSIRHLDALSIERPTLFNITDSVTIEDVLTQDLGCFDGFDIIVTNPPFAGDVSDAAFLDYYEVAGLCGPRVERDILFLERCKNLLRVGGRMAIVLPDNKFSGSKFSKLREWLLKNMRIKAIVSLHSYTFRPFTSQKTSILFAVRDENINEGYKIRFYRSDKPGKSSNGTPVLVDGSLDHDLRAIEESIIQEWRIG